MAVYESDRAAVGEIDICGRESRMIVNRNLCVRSVRHAQHPYELIFELQLVRVRSDLCRILRGDDDGDFAGSHLHPYAESIELFDVSRSRPVWRGHLLAKAPPGDNSMETYSSAEGYPVRAGDAFRISSVYNNPTAEKIDAMAAVFLFYSAD